MPSGKTLRGQYAVGAVATGASGDSWGSISFGFQMSAAPTPHYIPLAGAPPAQCPGTTANPAASPGHLCIYEASKTNLASLSVFGATGTVGVTSKWGAGLWLVSTAAGSFWSYGSWAATSP